MSEYIGWISSTLMIIAIVCGVTYGCTRNNQQYYDMAHNCIANGGSFIPTNNGMNDTAVCVSAKAKVN